MLHRILASTPEFRLCPRVQEPGARRGIRRAGPGLSDCHGSSLTVRLSPTGAIDSSVMHLHATVRSSFCSSGIAPTRRVTASPSEKMPTTLAPHRSSPRCPDETSVRYPHRSRFPPHPLAPGIDHDPVRRGPGALIGRRGTLLPLAARPDHGRGPGGDPDPGTIRPEPRQWSGAGRRHRSRSFR